MRYLVAVGHMDRGLGAISEVASNTFDMPDDYDLVADSENDYDELKRAFVDHTGGSKCSESWCHSAWKMHVLSVSQISNTCQCSKNKSGIGDALRAAEGSH